MLPARGRSSNWIENDYRCSMWGAGHGTAKHAIDLAMNSKDSFMQNSAAQRLGFLAQNGPFLATSLYE
jgi:hypothetical protein